jgi:hypothetical protein
MKGFAKATLPVIAGVILAGYVMYLGKDLPVIGDARNGFDV